MPESLIIGYGVVFDDAGRVLLLRRRQHDALWPGRWWLPGDVTPLSEEPDDTVPRLFEHLLRQRIRAGYAHTVYGEEPSSWPALRPQRLRRHRRGVDRRRTRRRDQYVRRDGMVG